MSKEITIEIVSMLGESKTVSEVESTLKLLTKLERGILTLLHTHPYAVTTKAIRNEIIMQNIAIIPLDIKVREFIHMPRLVFNPINGFLHKSGHIPNKRIKEFVKDMRKIWSSDESLYNKIGASDKKMPVPTPSFRSIEKAAGNLLKMGLVVKRSSQNSKEKGNWAIHPLVDIKLKELPVDKLGPGADLLE